MDQHTITIPIWRNDQEIFVDIEILSCYRGFNDTDDPDEVELATVGSDENDKLYTLTDDEYEQARVKFFN